MMSIFRADKNARENNSANKQNINNQDEPIDFFDEVELPADFKKSVMKKLKKERNTRFIRIATAAAASIFLIVIPVTLVSINFGNNYFAMKSSSNNSGVKSSNIKSDSLKKQNDKDRKASVNKSPAIISVITPSKSAVSSKDDSKSTNTKKTQKDVIILLAPENNFGKLSQKATKTSKSQASPKNYVSTDKSSADNEAKVNKKQTQDKNSQSNMESSMLAMAAENKYNSAAKDALISGDIQAPSNYKSEPALRNVSKDIDAQKYQIMASSQSNIVSDSDNTVNGIKDSKITAPQATSMVPALAQGTVKSADSTKFKAAFAAPKMSNNAAIQVPKLPGNAKAAAPKVPEKAAIAAPKVLDNGSMTSQEMSKMKTADQQTVSGSIYQK